jgi:hypothetical protein
MIAPRGQTMAHFPHLTQLSSIVGASYLSCFKAPTGQILTAGHLWFFGQRGSTTTGIFLSFILLHLALIPTDILLPKV